MTTISQQILENHQVRNTRKQKSEFIKFMVKQFPELTIDPGYHSSSRNLVLGNIETAKLIFTAHYDTPRRLLHPTLSFPKNRYLNIIYWVVLAAVVIPVMLPLFVFFFLITNNYCHSILSTLVLGAAPLAAFFAGLTPNTNNANDNTSGIIALCELYATLNEHERSQVAFVFFDNEERGLVGSKLFKALHPDVDLDNTLLINFDCVSDGNHVLFVLNKNANARFRKLFEKIFTPDTKRKTYINARSKTVHISSDHKSFDTGVGITTLHKRCGLLYLPRIHTAQDTVFEFDNIEYLVNGSKSIFNAISELPVD